MSRGAHIRLGGPAHPFADESRHDRPTSRRDDAALRPAGCPASRAESIRSGHHRPDLELHAGTDRGPRGRRRDVHADVRRRDPRLQHRGDADEHDAHSRSDHAQSLSVQAAGRVHDHLPRILRRRPPHDVRQGRGEVKPTPTVLDPAGFELPDVQKRSLRWTIYIGYVALTAGIFHGLAQALSYANIDILRFFPGLKGYYQGLTAHGVANALVFTFAFSNGFLPLMTARALGRPLVGWLVHACFIALLLGNLLVIYAVTTNQASV